MDKTSIDYAVVVQNIRANLRAYLIKSGLKALVIGNSGGIDSATCIALAAPVCEELGVELIGRWIKIDSNKDEELERANAIGAAFLKNYKEVELTLAYELLRGDWELEEGREEDLEGMPRKIRNGNLKVRMRMMYLYNLAQQHKGMVLSTDNFTELMLGFWTLHGDVGDYGMIQNLWKTEVFALAKWIALNECDGTGSVCRNALLACVEAIPTDGLGITDSDVEQFGAKDYYEVDKVLMKYFMFKSCECTEQKEKLESHPVVQRHLASEFKRENPYNIPRDEVLTGAMV